MPCAGTHRRLAPRLIEKSTRVRADKFSETFPPLGYVGGRKSCPPLEISRGSRIAKTRIKPSNFVLVPRVKNGRKKRLFLTLGSSSETRINTGFFPFLTLFLSQALGQLPRRPLSGLSPAARAPRSLVFSCAAPVEGRNFLKKVSSKTFSRLRAFGPAARTCVSLSIRRGFQPPPPGATCSAGAPVIRPSGSPGPKR